MKKRVLSCVWDDTSNNVRKEVHKRWRNEEVEKSFKQYCSLKTTKNLVKELSETYVNRASKEAKTDVQFLDAYIKNDKLYVVILSNQKHIANYLSYQCGSSINFLDESWMLAM